MYYKRAIILLMPMIFVLSISITSYANDYVKHIIEWTKYVGGSGSDYLTGQASLDNNGNIVISGFTSSDDIEGSINNLEVGVYSFVSKISPEGEVIWARYIGGDNELMLMNDVCKEGSVIIAGMTFSDSLPKLLNEPKIKDDEQGFNPPNTYVGKISADGVLLWTLYIGGENLDDLRGGDLKVSPEGKIYISGTTTSPDLANNAQDGLKGEKDAFIVKLNMDGNIIWKRYLGGQGIEESSILGFARDGDLLVAGNTNSKDLPMKTNDIYGENDMFLSKLSATTGEIRWTTYINSEAEDIPECMEVDSDGNIYLLGNSNIDLDVFDAEIEKYQLPEMLNMREKDYGFLFLVKISPEGDVEWSKHVGGVGWNMALDHRNRILISGTTRSNNLARRLNDRIGQLDIFLTRITTYGDREWSFYFGGRNNDFGPAALTINGNNTAFLTSTTDSPDIPNRLNEFHRGEDDDRTPRNIFVSRIRLPEIRDEAVGEDGVDENGDE